MKSNTYSKFGLFIAKCAQSSGAPVVDRGFTIEHDGLKRRGKCFVIRSPFTKRVNYTGGTAIAVGAWCKARLNEASNDMAVGEGVGGA